MDGEPLVVRADLVIPADELREEVSRSGGPGGQNVNKVATRVSLRWSLAGSRALVAPVRQRLLARLASRLTREGELVVHSNETRSQLQNRAAARVRMAAILREALHEPKQRRATRPTRSSRKRRLEGKQRRSGVKRMRGRPDASD
jgi:ribosome-associated protein